MIKFFVFFSGSPGRNSWSVLRKVSAPTSCRICFTYCGQCSSRLWQLFLWRTLLLTRAAPVFPRSKQFCQVSSFEDIWASGRSSSSQSESFCQCRPASVWERKVRWFTLPAVSATFSPTCSPNMGGMKQKSARSYQRLRLLVFLLLSERP